MYLHKLSIRNLRILKAVDIEADAGINLIRGINGSGKTSLLEALHVLGTGHSFRSREWRDLATHGHDRFLVRGVFHTASAQSTTVGIERSSHSTRVRMNGMDVQSAAVLARSIPLILITADSQRVLTDGASLRRRMIDWTMFHVEHRYGELQTRYRRLLKQRNAELRLSHGNPSRLESWEKQLADIGEKVHQHRREWLADILTLLRERLAKLLKVKPEIDYIRGWPEEYGLEEALKFYRHQDIARGYTSIGPHRADLRIQISGRPVKHVLSRGESKLFVIALLLAQAEGVMMRTQKHPLALIDDLTAELDTTSQTQAFHYLAGLGLQTIMTALPDEKMTIAANCHAVFEVEQGQVQRVV